MARVVATALSAALLLSGCVSASGPSALGAGYRSIKDDAVPDAAAPAPKQASIPKQDPAKTAIVAPPQKPRLPAAKRAEVPTCTGSECMVQLKALIDDQARTWITKAPPPAEYANGTRLFAYRALRSQLTCQQLTAALAETATAAKTFRTPVAGVSPRQASRVLALNGEVRGELQTELEARC